MKSLLITLAVLLITLFKIQAQQLLVHYPFGPEEDNLTSLTSSVIKLSAPEDKEVKPVPDQPAIAISRTPQRTSDRFGTENAAYQFNVTSVHYPNLTTEDIPQSLQQAATINIPYTYTFSVWINVPAPATKWSIIMAYGRTGSDHFISLNPDGNLNAGTYYMPWSSDGLFAVNALAPLPSYGEWHHVVSVRTLDSLFLYINGEKKGKAGMPHNNELYSSDKTVTLGCRSTQQYGFTGSIDDVRIYASALSEQAVSRLYESEQSLTTGIAPFLSATDQEIELFPNPVSDFVTVRLAETAGPVEKIDILDLSGKVLLSQSYGRIVNPTLSVATLAPGSYLMRVTSGSDVFLKKIIK